MQTVIMNMKVNNSMYPADAEDNREKKRKRKKKDSLEEEEDDYSAISIGKT